MGIPTIAVLIIDNQKEDINGWKETGFIEYAGSWDDETTYLNILKYVNLIISNYDSYKTKSSIGKRLVDGQGARRIIEYLLKKKIN